MKRLGTVEEDGLDVDDQGQPGPVPFTIISSKNGASRSSRAAVDAQRVGAPGYQVDRARVRVGQDVADRRRGGYRAGRGRRSSGRR